MPEIRVKLFANLREFTKTKELAIEGNNVREVLEVLCKRFPGLESMLLKNKDLQPHINVFLNGSSIASLETILKQNDEIAIFPPVSGG